MKSDTWGGTFGKKETLYARYEVMKQQVSLEEILTVPNSHNTGFEAVRRELKLGENRRVTS